MKNEALYISSRAQLQLHAQTLLRLHGIELGDDPCTEIDVALRHKLIPDDLDTLVVAGLACTLPAKV